MKRSVSLLALAVVLFLARTAMADLVTNGDFQYSGNMWYGWTQNAYGVGWGGVDNGNYSAAFSYFPGTLSQTISTTGGASYQFSFMLMHDSTGGTQDIDPHYPATQLLQVFWNGNLILTAPTYNFETGGSYYGYGWRPYTFTVQATGPSSTISFSGQDTGGYYCLDNVSVNQVSSTPLPAAVLLLGPGLMGLAALRRRFRV